MKLWALSDLHLHFPENRRSLAELPARPDDWLILAGDVGEKLDELAFALDTLQPRFARLIWVPGNHELWTMPDEGPLAPRGVARYERWVSFCQARGVLTPEDPYPTWEGEGGPLVLAPMFLLYDYTFRPDDVAPEQAVAWAAEAGIACTDEAVLHPDPYPSRAAWCEARVASTEARLSALPPGTETVLINHFALRQDTVFIPKVPRFLPWCGTRRTEDWHLRFRARVVVTGHLHMRMTQWRDGVRFEEVSLGYPRQRRPERGARDFIREILPGAPAGGEDQETRYYFRGRAPSRAAWRCAGAGERGSGSPSAQR